MKILSGPNEKTATWEREAQCFDCETRVLLTLSDLSKTVMNVLGPYTQITWRCPACHYPTSIEIPKHLHALVKDRGE